MESWRDTNDNSGPYFVGSLLSHRETLRGHIMHAHGWYVETTIPLAKLIEIHDLAHEDVLKLGWETDIGAYPHRHMPAPPPEPLTEWTW